MPRLLSLHRLAVLCSIGGFVFSAGAGSAQAAMITWGTETNILGDSDVSTNGVLVGAFNLGGPDTSVNGVTFQAFVIGPPQVVSATVDFATLSIVPDAHTLTNFGTSSALAPFSSLTPSYRSLLGTAAGGNFADGITTLTMAGLTIGKTYEFQAWANDSTVSGCCSYGIYLDTIGLDPNTATDPMSGDVVEGGLGQHVIGTFVADANSQALGFGRGEIDGGLNAFQLRDVSPVAAVPEPSTLALLGLGLAGLALKAKRSR